MSLTTSIKKHSNYRRRLKKTSGKKNFDEVYPTIWETIKKIRSKDIQAILALINTKNIPAIVIEELFKVINKIPKKQTILLALVNSENPEIIDWVYREQLSLSKNLDEDTLKDVLSPTIKEKALNRNITLTDNEFFNSLSSSELPEIKYNYLAYIYNPYFKKKVWEKILSNLKNSFVFDRNDIFYYFNNTATGEQQISSAALEWFLEEAQYDSNNSQIFADYLIDTCDFSKISESIQLKLAKALRHRIRESVAIASENQNVLFTLLFDSKEFIQEAALNNPKTSAEAKYVYKLVMTPTTPKNILKRILIKYKNKTVGNKLLELILNHSSMNKEDKKELIMWDEHNDLKNLTSISGVAKIRLLKDKKDISHWLLSFMEKENLNLLTWKEFKPYIVKNLPNIAEKLNALFVQFKGKISFKDLKDHIDQFTVSELEENSYLTYGKWDTYQRFKEDTPNLVIKLNFKFEYLEDINKDPEMRQIFKLISDMSYISGHPVVPVPGKTFAWVRITPLSKTAWLIDELQSDLHSASKTLLDREDLNFSPEKINKVISLTERWAEMAMSAVINTAKLNGIKDLYIPNKHFKIKQTNMPLKKASEIYERLPSKFHFKKETIDLGYGPDVFMHRIAKIKNN